ncbi:aminopeptidase [Roseibacillus persicicus]|uniref:Aminopeptidase n=1 Tax=Roseibacillus persicicus TaxID=454148 RepID=A0A918TFC3_9BACT|nr:aminopeptidase [Roseibacillus persicicus]MDQ8189238.1 aminopeptidase [Roseibacillus persicicus]GHC44308.1 aminopeptidase [Roseibacillus persicicus]
MITNTHLQRWADVLVRHATQVQPGDVVRITSVPAAEPLLEAVYRKVLEAGGLPVVNCRPEFLGEAFYELASEQQLDWVNPLVQAETELVDATINLGGSTNLRALDKFDPKRIQRAARANKASRELFFQRAAVADDPGIDSELRPLLWSTTLFPTNAYAQDAGMSLRDYCEFVVKACQLNQEDPVAFWQQLDAWQSALAESLMKGNQLRFQTPAGTDLTVDVSGMRWLSSPGRKNFPDGEVYSGPNLAAENGGAEGVVVFDKRCVYQGHAVRNARIVMEKGRATEVQAEEGEEFLISMLDQDEGARRIGEVAFGTNRAIDRATGQILFDEKMGGSFHLAFGAGYPETGNTNKSTLHWDLIAGLGEGSRVTLDGKPFCIDGRFVEMPPEVEWL